jgi:hypothetical protein
MTPAIIDFTKWLEDEDQLSIQDQVDVMTRIACRRGGPRVHGFVGFDPLRQALYDHHRRSPADMDPMAVVRRAIEVNQIVVGDSTRTTGGLVGVKLYPPMGFRATDNRHLPDASFNEPAYLRSPDTGLGSQIGSKLDAALSKLYTWCSDNNVPIMAQRSAAMAMRLATGLRLATRFSNEREPLPSFPRRRAGDDFLRFRIEEFDLAPWRAQRFVHHACARDRRPRIFPRPAAGRGDRDRGGGRNSESQIRRVA